MLDIPHAVLESRRFRMQEQGLSLREKLLTKPDMLGAMSRPVAPILALTPLRSTCRRLALAWGVIPVPVPHWRTAEGLVESGLRPSSRGRSSGGRLGRGHGRHHHAPGGTICPDLSWAP
jgi:hypothetical protein